VYPNPVRDELHLLVANELFDYRVTSLAGKIISQGSTWDSVQLDTNDWPAGVYMISLLSGKGSTCFKVIR
jgi:hypothetical protein